MKSKKPPKEAFQVHKDYRIMADPDCFIVQKRFVGGAKAKAPGKDRWATETYHATLAQAFKSIGTRIQLDNWPDIDKILQQTEELKQLVEKKLSVGV